uniref:Uncharacterized protein n=1 Tax=Glossina pallidipes TaxID=7398 RepID=A0A1A9Z677_GLOPL
MRAEDCKPLIGVLQKIPNQNNIQMLSHQSPSVLFTLIRGKKDKFNKSFSLSTAKEKITGELQKRFYDIDKLDILFELKLKLKFSSFLPQLNVKLLPQWHLVHQIEQFTLEIVNTCGCITFHHLPYIIPPYGWQKQKTEGSLRLSTSFS